MTTSSRRNVLLGAWISILLCQCTPATKPSAKSEQTTATPSERPRHGLTAEQASKVLFEFDDRRVTLGEFADALHDQSPYLRARYASPERRREFLENMIRFELLAHEAKRRHHDHDPAVVRAREEVTIEALMTQLFEQKSVQPEAIKEEDIRAYYETHRDAFRKPAQVRASQIVAKTQAEAKRILGEVLAAPEDMERFEQLALKHSVDPATRIRLGDLRFFSLTADAESADVANEVRKVAFTLKEVGDVYPEPIATTRGFVILKLTAKRDAFDRSLDDARPIIRNKLWREKREAAIERLVESLRKKANVKEDLSLLASIPLTDAPKAESHDKAP